jgi:hypothetical protein
MTLEYQDVIAPPHLTPDVAWCMYDESSMTHACWVQQNMKWPCHMQKKLCSSTLVATANHPPKSPFYRWYKSFPNGWFINHSQMGFYRWFTIFIGVHIGNHHSLSCIISLSVMSRVSHASLEVGFIMGSQPGPETLSGPSSGATDGAPLMFSIVH